MMKEMYQLNDKNERTQIPFRPLFCGPSYEELLMVGKKRGFKRDPKYLNMRKKRNVNGLYAVQKMKELMDRVNKKKKDYYFLF